MTKVKFGMYIHFSGLWANVEPIRIDTDGAHYYELEFNQISIRKAVREMSNKQKEAQSARMKSIDLEGLKWL